MYLLGPWLKVYKNIFQIRMDCIPIMMIISWLFSLQGVTPCLLLSPQHVLWGIRLHQGVMVIWYPKIIVCIMCEILPQTIWACLDCAVQNNVVHQ